MEIVYGFLKGMKGTKRSIEVQPAFDSHCGEWTPVRWIHSSFHDVIHSQLNFRYVTYKKIKTISLYF